LASGGWSFREQWIGGPPAPGDLRWLGSAWLDLAKFGSAWAIALSISPGADGAIGAGLGSMGTILHGRRDKGLYAFGFLSAEGLFALATRQGAARLACPAINPATTPGFSMFGR
jgi:hypothetical protein